MAYKDPNDERRIQKDFEYMTSERGYVGRAIGGNLNQVTVNMEDTNQISLWIKENSGDCT